MEEYNYQAMHQWAKEMRMKDARKDLDRRKNSSTTKCLSVSFQVNLPFATVEKVMAWLETGLRVWANEEGYEITHREIKEKDQ